MTHTAISSLTHETVPLSAVRIDAPRALSVSRMREYLEKRGCVVYRNKTPEEPVLYHIILGKMSFVKRILASVHTDAQKQLCIVVGSSTQEPASWVSSVGRLVYTDTVPATNTTIDMVFTFLFTGHKKVLDLRADASRKDMRTQAQNARSTDRVTHFVQTIRPLAQIDRTRIADTIRSLYADTRSTGRSRSVTRKHLKRGVYVGVMAVLVPLVVMYLLIGVSILFSFLGLREVGAANAHADRYFAWSQHSVRASTIVLTSIRFPLSLIDAEEYVRPTQSLQHFVSLTNLAGGTASRLIDDGRTFMQQVVSPVSTIDVANDQPLAAVTTQLKNDMALMNQTLGLIETQTKTLANEWQVGSSLLEQLHTPLQQLRQHMYVGEALLGIYSAMSGFGDSATYLVLLQNSMEVRPTGGFIGSVAEVAFSEGKLVDIAVHDVYALDGQLRGHVDPPVQIADIVGQEHWYLRDSNWDPDFRTSGAQAAWFYEKESGRRVDGVIAISTPLVSALLAHIGPIALPDYDETITADNFLPKALHYTQADFFPGSTQKRDFLGSLTQALLDHTGTVGEEHAAALFEALEHALYAKDVQFYFEDPDLQALAASARWAGVVEENTACQRIPNDDSCISGSVGVFEANVGVNKANFFVSRSWGHTVDVDEDGQIHETLTIQYENTADEHVFRGGGYRTYLRIYIPRDSRVDGVHINGARLSYENGAGTLPYMMFDQGTGTLRSIGIALEVPPKGSRSVVLDWTRSVKLPEGYGLYAMQYLKQAGIDQTPLAITTRTPENMRTAIRLDLDRTDLANESKSEYNTVLSRDRFAIFSFQRTHSL